MNPLNRLKTLVFGVALLSMAPWPAQAQSWPTQPIKLVVPYGAGSATDILARRVAAPLGQALGQAVVVDDKAGASGTIGAAYVAKAPADGYTLFFGTTQTQSVNMHLLDSMPYDPMKDFASLGRLFNAGTVLVVSAALPVNSLEELLAFIKANPKRANFGSTGFGTASHLPGAYWAKMAGINLTHVPYNNAGQLLTDLMRGEITLLFYPPDGVRSHIDSGALKVLAWTGVSRSPQYPNAPTMIERSYPNFIFGAWYAMFAPAGTPQAVVGKIAEALKKVVQEPKFVQDVAVSGASLYYAPPEELDAFVKTESERFRHIAVMIGAKKE